MKKRFLPFSLLLVIMVLGQSVIADQGGHYVPRTQPTMNAESIMGSLRANQKTGLIDPADMLKAMQAPATRDAADDPLYWISMGPDNMGGQTTAILYDNKKNPYGNPNGVVYIGSKGGGVYKTYNYGVTWHQVDNQDLMVSCMTQDPEGNIYVGTGDGNSAMSYNGLDQQGYDNSFIGSGIWVIDAKDDIEQRASTVPSLDGKGNAWAFINDIAWTDGYLVAATNDGLKFSIDKGFNWTYAKSEGEELVNNADEVRVAPNGTIIASVNGMIYIGSGVESLVCHSAEYVEYEDDAHTIISKLPKAGGLLDIAVSPTNSNVIYAACISTDGTHSGVYVSNNGGSTWRIAFPSITNNLGHNLYGGYGLYNHGLVVDPNDEGLVYVLGYNIWSLRKTTETGYYISEHLSGNSVIFLSDYVHVGMHAMVFDPNNANECYVGTDGGIYKATGRFNFYNCNRNYITSRMFNVAYCGEDSRVLAAGLDHGVVRIDGDENANTMGYGVWINPSGDIMGMFSESSQAGPCAISMLNPKTIFVTYKAGGLQRSQTAGEDWVSTNFTSSASISISTSSFRLPILLYEDYEDELNPVSVWVYNRTNAAIPGGTELQCMSENHFPFYYELPADLAAGDSILVHDPISARLYVSLTDALYMTRTPLDFGVETEWYKIADKSHAGFAGDPLCLGISADGDHMFVGMKNGKLYRVSNLNTVVDDASGTITDTVNFLVTTTEINLGNNDNQCVTSVAVDPRNANRVIVTCGNYGNDAYVYYSTNALADVPTFTSVQGDLQQMPVYSSVIEMATGDVIIGTEHGIYRTKDLNTWIFDSEALGDVPVMELKQQIMFHEDEQTVNVTDEGEFVTDYPGVHNTGIIYAATYGKGVFRCENYKQYSGDGVPETPAVAEAQVVMYPNPVRSEAVVSFNMSDNANVSYQVYDLTGRMVMSQNMGRFTEGEQEIRINMENLGSGSYILRLNQGSASSCVKFLVY